MEREGCDKRGRQQRSEREWLSSCMTEVLACWYIELLDGSVNAANENHINAADFLPHITSPPSC